eukprot:TRINITY_DN39629_c0_g1_i1.p1 TRINITY_DN39629_c0_g1~~TRINITY_DN39629_c0_g1_i1.p1  ORF type:complete len:542 (+),score=154.31 TRINITY_DN39629_c0_g1_i1:65-1690(+)
MRTLPLLLAAAGPVAANGGCGVTTQQQKDIPGFDIKQIAKVNLTQCTQLCCDNADCKGFTYVDTGAPDWGDCVTGAACCFLKNASGPTINSDKDHWAGEKPAPSPPTPAPPKPTPAPPAPTPPPSPSGGAPGPLDSYHTWVVLSLKQTVDGKVKDLYSEGQNVQASKSENSLCVFNRKILQPSVSPNTTAFLSNYTQGSKWTHNVNDKSGIETCAEFTITKGPVIPSADLWWLSPAAEERKAMTLVGQNITCDTAKCNQWHYMGPTKEDGSHIELFWTITVDEGIPMIYTNQTHFKNGTLNELTAAYDGNTPSQGLSDDCLSLASCGKRHCVANPTADDTKIVPALSWACGQGGVDCSAVQKGAARYYPNTVKAHANYVFDAYFQAHSSGGAGSCDFGGTGLLTRCMGSCTTCNATGSATEAEMKKQLDWVCGPDGIQSCDGYPGGDPDTTRSKLDWAMTKYYIAYECSTPTTACDFGGIGQVMPCGAPPVPTPKPVPTPAPPATPAPTHPAGWKYVCNGGLCQHAPYGASWDDCIATCGK